MGSVKKIFSHIISKKPHVVGRAIMRGLTGPNSFPFVQLMAAYIDGKPVERVWVSGTARMLFLPTRPMLGLPPAEVDELSAIDAESEPRSDED